MDMNENCHSFVLEKKHGDELSIHTSSASSDCQFYSQAMSMAPAASGFTTPVTLSAYPSAPVFESNHNNSSYIHVGKPVAMSSRGMLMPTVPGISPPIHPRFHSDFAFTDRALRFSCFNSGNSGGINPFGLSPDALKSAMSAQLQGVVDKTDKTVAKAPVVDHSSMNVHSVKIQSDHAGSRISISNSSSNEGKNSSGDPAANSSSSNIGANKRRRTIQNMEDQVQRGPQTSLEATKERVEATQKIEQSSSEHGGKTGNDNSETAKEDHVHVRARRGQAISSHSLAERLRREKISERMKCLQELVPGCSKVTGKAVMLDEIINYVQSLQRQVEFLSMKLSAVNPQLDFITEDILAKNVIHLQAGSSSTGFSQEINYPQMYPSQHGLLHVGISTMVNSSDAYRRAMNTQLPNSSRYEEPPVQALNEEQHSMKMPYGAHPSLNTQETNSKPDGFTM